MNLRTFILLCCLCVFHELSAQSVTIINRVDYALQYELSGIVTDPEYDGECSKYLDLIPALTIVKWSDIDSIKWTTKKPLHINNFKFPTSQYKGGWPYFKADYNGVNINDPYARMCIPGGCISYCWIQYTDTSDITVVIEPSAVRAGAGYRPYSEAYWNKYVKTNVENK